jgi:hypothetical protein
MNGGTTHALWPSTPRHLCTGLTDINAGLLERKLLPPFVLQTATDEIFHVLKESLVELTLRQSIPWIWALITKITDEFILGLDILQAYNTVVALKYHVLQLGQEGASLWHPRSQLRSSLLALASDKLIRGQCKRVVTAQLNSPLAKALGLVEPSLKTSHRGLYVAKAQQKVLPE